jgi:hypothetical protein
MNFITGDTHQQDIPSRFKTDELKKLNHSFNKYEDYMIVDGDFGLIWTPTPNQTEEWLARFLHEKPFITLFVDGNHENFERINALPEIDMFGGKVGKYSDSIFHLKRGEYYTIGNQTFLVMGGGVSIDKDRRRNRISWWEEEMPNAKEYSHFLDTLTSLRDKDYKVDYVLTHTAPDSIRDILLNKVGLLVSTQNAYGEWEMKPYKEKDQLSEFFQEVLETKLDFKKWIFGHYHVDADLEVKGKNFSCLYDRIIQL